MCDFRSMIVVIFFVNALYFVIFFRRGFHENNNNYNQIIETKTYFVLFHFIVTI